jgi:DNA-directed RNA polymerase specialized sigma24 family protein
MQHSDPNDKIVVLFLAIEHGDNLAVRNFWDGHYHPLVRMIRQWYGNEPRIATDEEDVAVDVLVDVIGRVQRGECRSVESEVEIVALLCVTARHRFLSQRRFDSRRKRFAGSSRLDAADDVAAKNSSPADDAGELFEDLISLLSSPHDNKLWAILMQIRL